MTGTLIISPSQKNKPTEQKYGYSRQTLRLLYIKPTICPPIFQSISSTLLNSYKTRSLHNKEYFLQWDCGLRKKQNQPHGYYLHLHSQIPVHCLDWALRTVTALRSRHTCGNVGENWDLVASVLHYCYCTFKQNEWFFFKIRFFFC